MTVDSTTNRKDYDPNGVVVAFPYNFRVDDADDMVVKEDGVVVVGGYTVSGVGEEAGGDVTFDVAPLDSVDLLSLIREVPLTQQTAYPALGPFPAGSHEAALDKLTFINQQQQEQLDRALLTETAQGPLSLPDPVAGKRLQWKDDLSGLKNVDSDSAEAEFWAGVAEDEAAAAVISAGDANSSKVLSEFWAGESEDEATAAAASAAQAAIDAANVADKASVDEVEAFKDDAEAAAILAGNSAAAAGLSELNASNSEVNAGFSAGAAGSSASAAGVSAGEASDSADDADASAIAAAASAAAAALYDPVWGSWVSLTLTASFTLDSVGEDAQYRLSSDGSSVQISAGLKNVGVLAPNSVTEPFSLPDGILGDLDLVGQSVGYFEVTLTTVGLSMIMHNGGGQLVIIPPESIPVGTSFAMNLTLARR